MKDDTIDSQLYATMMEEELKRMFGGSRGLSRKARIAELERLIALERTVTQQRIRLLEERLNNQRSTITSQNVQIDKLESTHRDQQHIISSMKKEIRALELKNQASWQVVKEEELRNLWKVKEELERENLELRGRNIQLAGEKFEAQQEADKLREVVKKSNSQAKDYESKYRQTGKALELACKKIVEHMPDDMNPFAVAAYWENWMRSFLDQAQGKKRGKPAYPGMHPEDGKLPTGVRSGMAMSLLLQAERSKPGRFLQPLVTTDTMDKLRTESFGSPILYKWLHIWEHGDKTFEEAMSQAALQLVDQNKTLLKQIEDLISKTAPPKFIYHPPV